MVGEIYKHLRTNIYMWGNSMVNRSLYRQMVNKIINFFKKKEFELVCVKNFSVKWTDTDVTQKGIIEFFKCKNTGTRKITVIGRFYYDAQKEHEYVLGAKSWVKTGYFLGTKLD